MELLARTGLLCPAACGSLLSGQFRNNLTETANNNTVVVVNVSEKYDQIVPVAELGMGLNYCAEHWHVSIGYEVQDWMNMVNSVDFPDTGSFGKVGRRTSDLSLKGWRFSWASPSRPPASPHCLRARLGRENFASTITVGQGSLARSISLNTCGASREVWHERSPCPIMVREPRRLKGMSGARRYVTVHDQQ